MLFSRKSSNDEDYLSFQSLVEKKNLHDRILIALASRGVPPIEENFEN